MRNPGELIDVREVIRANLLQVTNDDWKNIPEIPNTPKQMTSDDSNDIPEVPNTPKRVRATPLHKNEEKFNKMVTSLQAIEVPDDHSVDRTQYLADLKCMELQRKTQVFVNV